MRPEQLQVASFASYPPRARALAEAHLPALRQLPLNFLGILLSELIGYDWRFPVEQAEIDQQLRILSAAKPSDLNAIMVEFRALPLSPELYEQPWVAEPVQFVEKLTAYLWTVHAINAYRAAALKLGERMAEAGEKKDAGVRWCLVLVGRGARAPYPNLFRQLRPRGTSFEKVDTGSSLTSLLQFSGQRAQGDERAYAHWYVDGGEASSTAEHGALTTVSYDALAPVREELLRRMHHAKSSGTVGPENLRSMMAQLRPIDLPMSSGPEDLVLRHFQLSLLTEGSGTQIFSTTFVQWAAREVLRRAQPSTLFLRYAPRQVDRPMNDLLLASSTPPALDPEGSLVDASMGAYYTWINLQRLPGASQSRFLCVREGGSEAVAIAPGMAQGSTSTQSCTVEQILTWMA
jgi:hypothetical protein